MCFPSGGGAGKLAKQQRDDELARQARIASGMRDINTTFAGFDDGFFNRRRQAYENYAVPQLDRQYGDVKNNLIFALARSALGQSSAGFDKTADLNAEFDKNRIDITNRGLAEANTARSNVENVRSGLVSQLNATGDNSAAATAAVRQAENLNQPSGFSPLGQLFADFAGTVANIGSNSRNGFSGFFGGGRVAPVGGPGSARIVG